jgi:hypothetical protein
MAEVEVEKKQITRRSFRVAAPRIRNEVFGVQVNPNAPKTEFVDGSLKDTIAKVISDGKSNTFPYYVANLTAASATAIRCLSVYNQFLQGIDFSDKALWELRVCEPQTFYDMHIQLCEDYSLLRRFAIVVKWELTNGKLSKATLQAVPAKYVRYMSGVGVNELDSEHRLVYSPYMGDAAYSQQMNDVRIYYPYTDDTDEIVRQIQHARAQGTKYVGQMYFWNERPRQNSLYSIPPCIAAENDMLADSELSFRAKAITMNNFAIPSALIVEGDPDEILDDPSSYDAETGLCSKQIRFEDLVRARYENSFSGDKIGSTIILFERNGAKTIRFEAMPTPTNLWDFIPNVREDVKKQILMAFGVPNVLANIATAGKLGDSQEVSEAKITMNNETKQGRYILEQTYTMLLQNFIGYAYVAPITIVKVKEPVHTMPTEIWEVMTPEEKRKFAEENYL